MPAFVKTKKDEELWSKAKSRAKEQGHEGDWAYVTGIYKKMKGGKVAAERRLVAGPRWRDIGDEDLAYLRRVGIAKKKGEGMTAFGKKMKRYLAQYGRPGTGVEEFSRTKKGAPLPVDGLEAALDRIEKAAAYSKDFLNYVKGRRFRNPDTGNEVVFRSLPSGARREVYRQWKRDKGAQPSGAKTRPVFPDVPGLNKKKTRALMRDIVDEMKAADDASSSPDYHQVIRDHVDSPTPEQELAVHRGIQTIVKNRLKQMRKPRESDEEFDYDYRRWKQWLEAAEATVSDLREQIKVRKKRERRGPLVDPSRVGESVDRIQKILDRTKGELPRLRVKVTLTALKLLAENPKEERRIDKVRDRIRYLREEGTKRDRAMADEMAALLRDSGLSMRSGDYERKAAAEEPRMSGPRWRDVGDDEKKAMRRALAPVMIEDEEAVVLPSDVRRVSAERLRELGRALMVAGMRAPRQQMISIAVTLDALLDHLKLLGDQSPALNALRRRVLLKMRNQVLGSR